MIYSKQCRVEYNNVILYHAWRWRLVRFFFFKSIPPPILPSPSIGRGKRNTGWRVTAAAARRSERERCRIKTTDGRTARSETGLPWNRCDESHVDGGYTRRWYYRDGYNIGESSACVVYEENERSKCFSSAWYATGPTSRRRRAGHYCTRRDSDLYTPLECVFRYDIIDRAWPGFVIRSDRDVNALLLYYIKTRGLK